MLELYNPHKSFFNHRIRPGYMSKANETILAANQAFYDAFAAGDYMAMEKIWARNSEITVAHPGSVVLHGREDVLQSWQEILENSGCNQIRCVNPRVYLSGESAYVVCEEVFPEGRLVATNIFVLEESEWRLVHHHAGFRKKTTTAVSNSNKSLH